MTVSAFGLEEHVYSSVGANQSNLYYYFLAGHLVGSLDGGSGSITYYLTDALGSLLTSFTKGSGAAQVKGEQSYTPYGSSQYSQGSINTARGFTGQYADTLTGLDYYNARYYDPVVGVFLSADSVQGNPQGMNPYAYVGGNPETRTDATGHSMGTNIPLSLKGGAVGYAIPGTNILTTVINSGYLGSVTTLNGQVTLSTSDLVVNTFTRQQQAQYGNYNPNTDAQNSTLAKIESMIGWTQLQQTWNDPHATWQDKLGAIGNFLGTNANNVVQLAMILGGPEGEEVVAAEEEVSSLVEDTTGAVHWPTDQSQLSHIFRDTSGHFPEDTLADRQAILDTINSSNYVGSDSNGVEWYTQSLPNGQQIWVSVRNGEIQNAGINNIPRIWDSNKQRLVGN